MAKVYNSQLDAFDLYHKIQENSEKSSTLLSGPVLPAVGHAIAGSTGAAISNVTTYPLALIVTRLQVQGQSPRQTSVRDREGHKSIPQIVQKIYQDEGGIRGLYVGATSDTGKTIADSFLFFLAYNFLHQTRMRPQGKPHREHLPAVEELGIGFVAGAFTKILTTPIATIVTRKQTNFILQSCKADHPDKDDSIRAIAKQIYQEKGLQGFWSGYSASLILTLNPSLTFFLYENLKRISLSRDKRTNTPPQATFLLAALSKAIASAITYPFSLAKTRMQAHRGSQEDSEMNVGPTRVQSRNQGQSNIFTIVLQIARNEGVKSLYEGLHGELLKGFFSHGTTMIVKEAVHKVIIQLYYAVLKILRRYPNSEALAQKGKELAGEAVTEVRNQVRLAADKTNEGVNMLSQNINHQVYNRD
ncbi:uncharacterized protein KY384_003024 [Bacidia gigantensis]|uniref:uncharacterized protein n=1 Tax=Bacidia gigantensis TaxID=2732470 RepID=UPI001D035E70|nr:uncharacterized protein KY384_003024 [Bacidia gigantensis]KAG8531395.1 hypothetical protein KY384_003024 [Bacidia gigantensis]